MKDKDDGETNVLIVDNLLTDGTALFIKDYDVSKTFFCLNNWHWGLQLKEFLLSNDKMWNMSDTAFKVMMLEIAKDWIKND